MTGEVQRGDEEEEGRAADSRDRQACRVTLATLWLVPPLHQRKRRKQAALNRHELREDDTTIERILLLH